MARVRRRGKKFVLDYRIGKLRPRITFDSREEAKEMEGKYNALKLAGKLSEFQNLLNARQAIVDAEIKLTGKSLSQSIAEYAKTCSTLKSKQTQRNERGDFKNLFDFLSGEKDVHFLREVTPQMLEEHQGRLLGTVSASTCNRRFNGIKNFFNKCVEWGYLEKSPARFIKNKKVTAKPRQTLTDDEIVALERELSSKPHVCRPFMIEAREGTRPGEPLQSRVRDYDRSHRTLTVYSGKNSEVARNVHLHPESVAIIEQILSERVNLKVTDFIFVNTRGKPLRPAIVTKAVRVARRKLGIAEGKTPYGLRHSFATKLARLDVAQEKTKKLMGHASGRTTENYYKLEQKDLRVTVDSVAKVFEFSTGKEIETVANGHKIG